MDTFKYVFDKVMTMRCVACQGKGHEAKDCTSKKKVDKTMKLLGIRCEWGEAKSKMRMISHKKFSQKFKELMKEKNAAKRDNIPQLPAPQGQSPQQGQTSVGNEPSSEHQRGPTSSLKKTG